MGRWVHARSQPSRFQHSCLAFLTGKKGAVVTGLAEDALASPPCSQWSWDMQPGTPPAEQANPRPASMTAPLSSGRLRITTMSGQEVACLPVCQGESCGSLKRKIHQAEGTAIYMQKLIQAERVLRDDDLLSPELPVVLVRVQRKMAVVASIHSDLRFYDLESGEAIRSASSQNLRLTCLTADWESSQCFSGSADGAVRVWDTCTGECLQVLRGHRQGVCVLCAGGDSLLAGACDGLLLAWQLAGGAPDARVRTGARGQLLVEVDWPRATALVAGEGPRRHGVAAYSLAQGSSLWALPVDGGPPTALSVDWLSGRCLVATGTRSLEVWGLADAGGEGRLLVGKFGPQRLHPRGLVSTDWCGDRVLTIAEPYALEVWSLRSLERLHRLRDPCGDGTTIVSLHANWSLPVPHAIVCRHYIDWELVAGEVCIQHWDIQDAGDVRSVCAHHPMVGGFDIVAVAAHV
mmetsp:Transcript_26579/g.76577  ORF Transcript_26579/g.76577 Transcript_26579/m.76577 type:complete len:462 (-) Transcript_26579:137-1522(-)